MPDRDNRCAGEPLGKEAVELRFGRLVERGRGLVEKEVVGRLEDGARDSKALLLAERQHAVPMRLLGEQQRLGIARSILQAPDYLFLDEATASLDEATEARLYHLLAEKLPHTTLVSIGHRASLEAFHRRNMALVPDGNHFRLQERALAAAPA